MLPARPARAPAVRAPGPRSSPVDPRRPAGSWRAPTRGCSWTSRASWRSRSSWTSTAAAPRPVLVCSLQSGRGCRAGAGHDGRGRRFCSCPAPHSAAPLPPLLQPVHLPTPPTPNSQAPPLPRAPHDGARGGGAGARRAAAAAVHAARRAQHQGARAGGWPCGVWGAARAAVPRPCIGAAASCLPFLGTIQATSNILRLNYDPTSPPPPRRSSTTRTATAWSASSGTTWGR
jgi:hypothetical protein